VVVAAARRRRFATWKSILRFTRSRTRCESWIFELPQNASVKDLMGAPRPAGTEEVRNVGQILALENGSLKYTANKQVNGAATAFHLIWTAFNGVILGGKPKLDAEIASGDIKLEGTKKKLYELLSLLDNFYPWFKIVTP
jgi:hypothetical protein